MRHPRMLMVVGLVLLVVAGCESPRPSASTSPGPATPASPTSSPTAVSAATITPSPPPTELSVPPTWVRDAKTIPNPPIGSGTPWLLAAADRDGDQLIVRNTEGASCHDPIRTVLAWYQFGGGAPQSFYTTPDHSQVLQIAANADFVVWTEMRMVYQGPPPSQPPCPPIDLPWLRVLVLRRDTGAVVEVDRDDVAAPAGRFVLDGSQLVYARRQSPGGYDEHRLESLELRDLGTGFQRTLLHGQEGEYLSPVALAWPRLVWAERTLGGSGERAELSWASAEADSPSPHLMTSGSFAQVPAGVFLDDALYLSSSQGVTRYHALDRAPDSIQSGPVGVGIRSIAAARHIVAWTAQQAPVLSLYAVGTGQTYRVDSEVWELVATKDSLIAQQVSGSGPIKTFSLSRIAHGP